MTTAPKFTKDQKVSYLGFSAIIHGVQTDVHGTIYSVKYQGENGSCIARIFEGCDSIKAI